jgi:hypothetical protein
MIPKNITRKSIIQAIDTIDIDGVPKMRESTKYHLINNDKQYPPKYLISLANKYTNGYELKPQDFSGGKESNEFLRKLDFEVIGNDEIEVCNDKK